MPTKLCSNLRAFGILSFASIFACGGCASKQDEQPATEFHSNTNSSSSVNDASEVAPTRYFATTDPEYDGRPIESTQFEYGVGGYGGKIQAVPPTDLQRVPAGNESYTAIEESAYKTVRQHPLSTFSIDVDTASYSNVRRFLESGQIPPKDAIRIEEMINYFTYDDPAPVDGRPFSVNTEVAVCPWDDQRRLLRIGLKGREVETAERQPTNLVFLIDVSGSMQPENKLPLIQRSLHRLLEDFSDRDRVAIVTYASGVNVPLPSIPANQQHRISKAIDNLRAGGSTNGEAGLRTAYKVARQQFLKFGTNRVILCSDGDFNVGMTNEDALVNMIQQQATSGVFLSVLGFGTGNYKDSLAEKLADSGNGNYAYIDSYSEARKVLVDQMTGTLETIAKDVKIQVEFNPANVATYRLIGYENRKLDAQDFRNDRKDAGEIGAGHSVTALYEVIPVGADTPFPDIPALRYQQPATKPNGEHVNELLTVRLRYKMPRHDNGTGFAHVVEKKASPFENVSPNFRFATSVAAFGMILRDSAYAPILSWNDIRSWAVQSIENDQRGYRTEFLNLITQAEQLIQRSSPHRELSYHSDEILPDHTQQVRHVRIGSIEPGPFSSIDVGAAVPLLVVVGVSCVISLIRKFV